MTAKDKTPLTLDAWQLVRRMLDDLTQTVEDDAETESELLEGLRVLARTTALASEISLDVDPAMPWFFSMNTEVRYLGGPAPDGEYFLAMIDGQKRYRVRGEPHGIVRQEQRRDVATKRYVRKLGEGSVEAQPHRVVAGIHDFLCTILADRR